MAKVNPPRSEGRRISAGLPTAPAFYTKKFWMDMPENEFRFRLGTTRVKTGSLWPVLPLIFFLSVLIFSLVKIAENNVAWFNYIGLGLSLLGILMTII